MKYAKKLGYEREKSFYFKQLSDEANRQQNEIKISFFFLLLLFRY